ncbi:MAG: hypothetical protein GAK45_01437 [Pseudomonas citronellolis]|nr:MAG: hypothetical protein GAK45_01437 [Pseudomonas citronellolis]
MPELKPAAIVRPRHGDPEAFGEHWLEVVADIQSMPYGAKLYAIPADQVLISRQELEALLADKARLDAIEGECWDVRYSSSPNADAGDSSIGIEIIGHYQGAPHVRVLGENYSENLRAAIDQAMTAEAYPPERPEYDDNGRPLRALP